MKVFEDLEFNPHSGLLGGIHARMDFDNGYGVSVVQSSFTYGGEEGLYEMAVMKDDHICYDTPITSDVLGYLSEEDVTVHMIEVQNLED